MKSESFKVNNIPVVSSAGKRVPGERRSCSEAVVVLSVTRLEWFLQNPPRPNPGVFLYWQVKIQSFLPLCQQNPANYEHKSYNKYYYEVIVKINKLCAYLRFNEIIIKVINDQVKIDGANACKIYLLTILSVSSDYLLVALNYLPFFILSTNLF